MASQRGLLAYLGALLRHWADFITGGFVAAVVAVATGALGVRVSGWQFAGIFLWCGVLIAGFKAWQERHLAALDATANLDVARADRDRASVEHERTLASVRSEHERTLTATRADLDECRSALRSKPSGPKLSLQFDPLDPRCVAVEGGDETFRVKVVNDGDTRASSVSVVLSDVIPNRTDILNQHFRAMRVTCPPSE